MLKRRHTLGRRGRAGQRGLVLIVALVVLVAITIAGAAMMRSVDTSTLVAGNLAFQQAATHAADKGIEQALAMLQQKAAAQTLHENDTSNGYVATRNDRHNPPPGKSWQQFWQESLSANARDAGQDQFNNHLYYVVHRECAEAKVASQASCVSSPASTASSRNSQRINPSNYRAATSIYYRITVRVVGPRRTESYVQAYVAM
jgi:type IV pilus assembly protein PilX